tara:strand:+ start:234 stop:1322 length:1089 start_codon:yes stop_codon:yes gene_type:complete
MKILERTNLSKIKRIFEPYEDRKLFHRLDRNEDPVGWDKKNFKNWINSISPYDLAAYSDSDILVKKLCDWLKVKTSQIYITAGSDAAIKNIFEVFIAPNQKVILQDPSWRMFEIYCKIYQAKIIKAKYSATLEISAQHIIDLINKSNAKMIVLANPNQPTGTIFNKKELTKIFQAAQKNGVIVVVDEAYYLFTEITAIKLINKFNNIIIVRTFSKAFGLAGLRIGYCVASSSIIKKIKILRPVTDSNSLAIKAALYAINNLKWSKIRIKNVIEARNWLYTSLKNAGIKTYESHTNFLLFKCGNTENSKKVIKLIKKKGYLIKGPFDKFPLNSFLRVSIGPLKLMKQFWKDCGSVITKYNDLS